MLPQDIFKIRTPETFQKLSLQMFRYQYQHVPVYRKFCDHLDRTPSTVSAYTEIPFLPIEFFKSSKILSEERPSEIVFTSSGTTGSTPSKHFVGSLSLYEESFQKIFQMHYGTPETYTILALLPSYLEREGSSLVYMVDRLIKSSKDIHSGFYLSETAALMDTLQMLEEKQKNILLIGVSYALLDLIEKQQFKLQHTIVMETGGMKGRRKELIRTALHEQLKKGFGLASIHSEYGMTELLSQAYSKGDGIFNCPPWMTVMTRDPEDPFTIFTGRTGGINVIDLANMYSCSFIATQDLGKVHPNGSFEVLGRFDTSDIRGCNLMAF